jgi:drug/metabolite transporter (DMT)-like permease
LQSNLRHAALIAFAYSIWSSWGVFVRALAMDARLITFYVGVVACVVTLALQLVQSVSRRESFFKGLLPPPHGRALFIIGSIFMLNNVPFLLSMQLTTIANAIFAHYLAPVLVAVLAPLVIGEARLKSAPVALALATLGMALIMPGVGTELGGDHLLGIAVGAGGALSYAFMIMLSRKFSVHVPVVTWVFYTNLVVCLWVAPWALTSALPDARQWGILAIVGSVHAVFAACCYLWGIRGVRAQTASVLGYLEPLGAVALAALFLAETPTWLAFTGGALILLSGYLTVRADRRDKLEGAP